jgi:hypothetical protein
MKDFILIKETRIKKNTIKKYMPIGVASVNIYYSVSRYKSEVETFKFNNEEERETILELLDSIL